MRKQREIKEEVSRWNKEVFGNVDVRCAELEHKISRLDEQEAAGNWSGEANDERLEARYDLLAVMNSRFQIDSQTAKVR